MSGHFLRHGDDHRCSLPTKATTGDVWQCDECDRRWTCWRSTGDSIGGCHPDPAEWRRRYWPWPRPPHEEHFLKVVGWGPFPLPGERKRMRRIDAEIRAKFDEIERNERDSP